jgi:hypothetical protein
MLMQRDHRIKPLAGGKDTVQPVQCCPGCSGRGQVLIALQQHRHGTVEQNVRL